MGKSRQAGTGDGKTRQSVPVKLIVDAGPVSSKRITFTHADSRLKAHKSQVIGGYSMEDAQGIRLKLVNRIRRLIARGRYTIDAEKIAQKMLEEEVF